VPPSATPPTSEAILVAYAVVSPTEVPEAIRYVDETDFEDARLSMIWGVLVKMVNEGLKLEDIDPVSIGKRCASSPEMQKAIALFVDKMMVGIPRNCSLVIWAQRVRRKASLRLALTKMREMATDIKEQLTADDGEVPDLEGRIARLSIALAERSDKALSRATYHDVHKDVSKYLDELIIGPSPDAISTGLPDLNHRLGGGFRPGRLYTIAACTGSGKTTLASQMCDAAIAHEKRAIMFSMELDPVDVFIRDVERRSGHSRWALRSTVDATKQAAQEAIFTAAASMIDKPGKIIYGESLSVDQIRQAILTEQLRGGKVHLIAVDHAQVAQSNPKDRKIGPRYLEVKAIAEGLRQVAKHLGVAVILTSQMNPPPKGERLTMALIRESKDIVNASDAVLLIDHKRDEGGSTHIIAESWIIVDKAREGAPGRVQVKYRGELFRFDPIEAQHYQSHIEGGE